MPQKSSSQGKSQKKPSVNLTPAGAKSPASISLGVSPIRGALPFGLDRNLQDAWANFQASLSAYNNRPAFPPMPVFTPEMVSPNQFDVEAVRAQAQADVPIPGMRVPEPVMPQYAPLPGAPSRPAPRLDPQAMGLAAVASLFAGSSAGQVAAAPLQAAVALAEQEYQDRLRDFEMSWRQIMERNRQEAERAQTLNQYQRDVAEQEYRQRLANVETERARRLAPAYQSLSAAQRAAAVKAGEYQQKRDEIDYRFKQIAELADEARLAAANYMSLLSTAMTAHEGQEGRIFTAAENEKRRRHEAALQKMENENRLALEALRSSNALNLQNRLVEMGLKTNKLQEEILNANAEIAGYNQEISALQEEALRLDERIRRGDIDTIRDGQKQLSTIRKEIARLMGKRKTAETKLKSLTQSGGSGAGVSESDLNRIRELSEMLGR